MTPEQRGPGDLWADSNGCAAGNTLEEAILQGFLELVERDASRSWWYNRLRCPPVDLQRLDDAYLAGAADYYRTLGRDMWLLDISADFPIPPSWHCRAGPTRNPKTSSTEPARTPMRASAPACGVRDEPVPDLGAAPARPAHRNGVDDPMCLAWCRTRGSRTILSGADPRGTRAGPGGLSAARDRRHQGGRRALLCPGGRQGPGRCWCLNRPGPISHAGGPCHRDGHAHFWERFAPGRLYEVPVQMGQRTTPLAEADLNPVAVIA